MIPKKYTEKMTDRARRVMLVANREAQNLNHDHLGVGHVLLAIIAEGFNVVAQVLKDIDSEARVEESLRKNLVPGDPIVTLGMLPMTPKLKSALEMAFIRAGYLGDFYIGCEHIALGMNADEDGILSTTLICSGISPKLFEDRLLQYAGKKSFDPDPTDANPLTVAAIPPILRAVMDGKWVRIFGGKIETREAKWGESS